MSEAITSSSSPKIPQKFSQRQIPNEDVEPVKEKGYSGVDDPKNVNDSEFFDDAQNCLELVFCESRDNSAITYLQKACDILLFSLLLSSVLPNISISPNSKNYETLLKNDRKRIESLSENMKDILNLILELNLIKKDYAYGFKIEIDNHSSDVFESKCEDNEVECAKEIINDNLNIIYASIPKIEENDPLFKNLETLKIILNKSLKSHENIFSTIFFYIIDSVKLLLKKFASIFITPNKEDQLIDLLSSKIKTVLHMNPYRAVPLEIVTERIRNRRSQESSATVDPNALSIIPEPELV